MSYSERVANLESTILGKMVLFEKAKALCILTEYRDDRLCRATVVLKHSIEDLRKQLRACERIMVKHGLA